MGSVRHPILPNLNRSFRLNGPILGFKLLLFSFRALHVSCLNMLQDRNKQQDTIKM